VFLEAFCAEYVQTGQGLGSLVRLKADLAHQELVVYLLTQPFSGCHGHDDEEEDD